MRIPRNEEYDLLVEATGGDDEKMHWKSMYSFTDDSLDEYQLGPMVCAARGGYSASNWGGNHITNKGIRVGFRPAFDLYEIDSLASEGELSIIGTLFMAGQPVRVSWHPEDAEDVAEYIPGAKLEVRPPLGDPAYIITGFRVGNAVVADRVLLSRISYKNIEKALKISD